MRLVLSETAGLPLGVILADMGSRRRSRSNVIVLGDVYRSKQRASTRQRAVKVLGVGVALGVLVGFHESGDLARAATVAGTASKEFAVSQGIMRANTPQPGAYYRYCADARAAGVAPLYAGEPGYRPELDRDSDGVACEPYRGHR